MNDDEQAAQHADETRLQKDMLQALEASLTRPLSMDEALLLAWGSGCANGFYRDTRPKT